MRVRINRVGGRNRGSRVSKAKVPVPPSRKRCGGNWAKSVSDSAGTASKIPTLVLPVDQTIQFNLWSPDVIHSFQVTNFLMKMDVVPGRVNQFQVHTTKTGDYVGKCFELCGTYHSRMLFDVKVVSQEEYDSYLQTLESSSEPLLGGADAYTLTGLAEDQAEEGSQE